MAPSASSVLPKPPTGSERARERLRTAIAARAQQDIDAALDAIDEARRIAPDDAEIALADAHLNHDGWRPAAARFERAAAFAPGAQAPVKGWASALYREGDGAAGRDLLAAALHEQPGWVDGHRQLATMRLTAGQSTGFDRSFADACAAEPANLALRLGWFHFLSTAKAWDSARAVLRDGEIRLGPQRAFDVARIFLASESDEASRDPMLFDPIADLRDVGVDLCRTRFWLRIGQPERAVAVALPHAGGTAERAFWPYLALAWRLLGDPRSAWIEQDGPLLASHDLGLSPTELASMSATLRGLLIAQAPLPEQSVRGGVQTDGMLFFHPDPLIRKVRARVGEAIAHTVAALPERVKGHPLLGPDRDEPICFDGSWAVLLGPGGRHASHTHSRGWISSALHLALPDAEEGESRLEFGRPPPELGLALAPSASVVPAAGQLHLFSSTQWHCTTPFERGDRLTIAFDVQVPRPTTEKR